MKITESTIQPVTAIKAGDSITEVETPEGPFYPVLKVNAKSIVIDAAEAMRPGRGSAMVKALEQGWADIHKRHPNVPEAVVILGAGTMKPGQLKLGHFTAARWDVAGSSRAEVLIGGEGLKRGPVEVLGTLLHEAAHGVAHVREVKDTSRGGRYHNTRYRDLAAELGLSVAQTGAIGWSGTSVPPETERTYRATLARLDKALTLWRRGDQAGEGKAKDRNLVVAICACLPPRIVRTSRSTLDAGPITCGLCEHDFIARDNGANPA